MFFGLWLPESLSGLAGCGILWTVLQGSSFSMRSTPLDKSLSLFVDHVPFSELQHNGLAEDAVFLLSVDRVPHMGPGQAPSWQEGSCPPWQRPQWPWAWWQPRLPIWPRSFLGQRGGQKLWSAESRREQTAARVRVGHPILALHDGGKDFESWETKQDLIPPPKGVFAVVADRSGLWMADVIVTSGPFLAEIAGHMQREQLLQKCA